MQLLLLNDKNIFLSCQQIHETWKSLSSDLDASQSADFRETSDFRELRIMNLLVMSEEGYGIRGIGKEQRLIRPYQFFFADYSDSWRISKRKLITDSDWFKDITVHSRKCKILD